MYTNLLSTPDDIADFILEGDGAISFPQGRLRLESTRDPAEGQAANLVLWCPQEFEGDVAISWDFYPLTEPGLAICFFHARGHDDRDLFDPSLQARTGIYDQYHHGDLNAYHISYFRRMWDSERRFHTCNLRKSYGFHLVAQGADPLPGALDADPPYRMEIRFQDDVISFSIDGLQSFQYHDDSTYGPPLRSGKIGLRQMAPLVAEYANLRVEQL